MKQRRSIREKHQQANKVQIRHRVCDFKAMLWFELQAVILGFVLEWIPKNLDHYR